MNLEVLVDNVGSGGGSVGVHDLSSIGALVGVKAGNSVLDLVHDRLVLTSGGGGVVTSDSGAGGGAGSVGAGHARDLVVHRLAGGLVLVGLEVSDVRQQCVMMMTDGDERQTWRRGRRDQWHAPW